jgi:hypothetical protein
LHGSRTGNHTIIAQSRGPGRKVIGPACGVSDRYQGAALKKPFEAFLE